MTMYDYLDNLEGYSWYTNNTSRLESELLHTYDLEDFETMKENVAEAVIGWDDALGLYEEHKNEIWQKCSPSIQLENCDFPELFEVRMTYEAIENIAYKVMEELKIAQAA